MAPPPRPPPPRPWPRSCPPPPTSTSARRSPTSSLTPAPSASCARSLAPSSTCASTRTSRPSSPRSRWSTTASASCSRWPSISVRGTVMTPLEPSTAAAPVPCCYWEQKGAVPCTEFGEKITSGMYAITFGMLVALLLGLNMSWSTITAALALIFLDFKDARPYLEKVSYPLLLFFCGMFITVDGFNKTGIPITFWEFMEPYVQIDTLTGVVILALFSPVGHYFASASHDRTARIWSMDRIQPLRIMAGHHADVDMWVNDGGFVLLGCIGTLHRANGCNSSKKLMAVCI